VLHLHVLECLNTTNQAAGALESTARHALPQETITFYVMTAEPLACYKAFQVASCLLQRLPCVQIAAREGPGANGVHGGDASVRADVAHVVNVPRAVIPKLSIPQGVRRVTVGGIIGELKCINTNR